jgi:anti-sigma-K factor RskA
LVADQAHEQIELLLEERLVVGEIEAEQRKRVRQRAATDNELRPAIRHRVERRELPAQW